MGKYYILEEIDVEIFWDLQVFSPPPPAIMIKLFLVCLCSYMDTWMGVSLAPGRLKDFIHILY